MAATTLHVIYLLCLLNCFSHFSESEKVSMRLVEEPSNFGYNADTYQQPTTLTAKVKASNVTGPVLLKNLAGKCFDMVNDQYKYMFCPFHNVTQHEQSLRWNPYSGILGVYQEWKIINNTFVAMIFKEGDACGEKKRQVSVYFKCNDKHDLQNVSEPQTCEYQLTFATPLVCHQHSMIVYPTLPETLQQKWDELEGELVEEEITEQGYQKRLHKIFEEAGYVLPPNKALQPAHSSIQNEQIEDFDNLATCNEEFKKLKLELENLKQMVPHEAKPEIDPVKDDDFPFKEEDFEHYAAAADGDRHPYEDIYDYR
ncbi:N-acetylglucosamine-1-phosphotransferase subunit gamma-like [Glandiceps talaboti]